MMIFRPANLSTLVMIALTRPLNPQNEVVVAVEAVVEVVVEVAVEVAVERRIFSILLQYAMLTDPSTKISLIQIMVHQHK